MGKLLSKRKIVASLVILVGIISSVLILNQDFSENNQPVNNKESDESELLNFESFVSDIQNGEIEQRRQEAEDNENATERLINSFASNFASDENINMTEEEFNETLNNNLNISFSDNLFSLKDIQISQYNTKEAKIEYIEKVGELVYENFKEFEGETSLTALRAMFEDNDTSLVDYLVRRAPMFINDMLSLKVPPSLTEEHIEMLNIWQKKLEIYKAIRSYNEDPLKAHSAIQELSNVIQEDADFQAELIETYQNLNS